MRVAAYCRVSTDKSDQLQSFESQKDFFTSYIDRQPNWQLVNIYADAGVTGTTTSNRDGFLKMIDDALAGKLDLILTKEVSRFSRNLLDAVGYTRALKQSGVGVVFLNDGISTLDPDAELRLSIMASVAQEESRKTSERVKWGQRRQMERGVVFGRNLLGYTVHNGRLTIEPHGAEIVTQIYRMYLGEGQGTRKIACELTQLNIPTMTGKSVWSAASVLKIIKNEKYCGDLCQRKTITTDYLTHKKSVNKDDSERIILQDHHEPIISKEDWHMAQVELKRRTSSIKDISCHGSRYTLSAKLVSKRCKSQYYCRTRQRADGTTYRTWRCNRPCTSLCAHFREEFIAESIRGILGSFSIEELTDGLDTLIHRLCVLDNSDEQSYRNQINLIDAKKRRLLDAYLQDTLTLDEFKAAKENLNDKLTYICAKISENTVTDTSNRVLDLMNIIFRMASDHDENAEFYLSLVDSIDIISPSQFDVSIRNLPGLWTVTYI